VSDPTLQDLCERGSERLVATDYIGAERLLAQAEAIALADKDWDTLSRLYFPLQESRRQIRTRCAEGGISLDLESTGWVAFSDRYTHGQFLVPGEGTTGPGERLRETFRTRGLYAEAFLALSVSLPNGARIVAATPNPSRLTPTATSLEHVQRQLPPHSIVVGVSSPNGETQNFPPTPASTTSLWQQLHLPFLALADAMPVSEPKLHAYRRVLDVDYACELAHQNAAAVARELARLAR
jgi:hypothetical protein